MNIGKACGLILMFFSGVLFSQSLKLGVTGNFNKSSIVGVHGISEPSWGGSAGFFANISLVENDIFDSAWLYFQPQLEFSKQGERGDWDENEQDYQKYDMGYIAMPLYIKYFFHRGNMKNDFFVFAGPKLEYLVYSKVQEGTAVRDAQAYGYDPATFGLGQRFNKFGYGVSFGAGVKVIKQGEVFLRYDRGFSKVYPDYMNRNTYNRYIALGFSYYFTENWY